MATYKKRGDKPKNQAEKISQIEQESTTAEVFSTLDEGASRTEAWVEKKSKNNFNTCWSYCDKCFRIFRVSKIYPRT